MVQLLVSPTIPCLAAIISGISTPKHLACPHSLCRLQGADCPRSAAFLPVSSLPPLPSPEGESPSRYRFLCPDKSFPLRSPPRAPREVAFIPCPGPSSARSPSRGGVLALYQASLCGGLSRQLPASPYALRSNASGVAVVASQPHQQTRRRRCPWPWQVQRPRPAALPLVRACQRSRARLPPHRIGVHNCASEPKRARRYRRQVRCPLLTMLPLLPPGF